MESQIGTSREFQEAFSPYNFTRNGAKGIDECELATSREVIEAFSP
jgi:hypothetical protein